MADEILTIDSDGHAVMGGVTNNAAAEIRNLLVDPSTGRLLVDANVSVTGDVGVLDQIDLTNSNPLAVAIVDASGDQVTSFGGGTEYTEDVASPADPKGGAVLMTRDDQLSAVTEIEGDWSRARGTSKGALWVAMADSSGDPITSFGGGAQYVEDAAAAADPTGTALNLIRADSLAAVTTTDGDNVAARGTNKGEQYVKHVDSIIVTNAGTFAVQVDGSALTSLQLIDDVVYTDDTSTHATGTSKGVLMMGAATPTDAAVNANDIGALAMTVNRELLVQVNTALPAGTNAIGKLSANSGVDIGDVDITSIVPGVTATSLGKAEDAIHGSGDIGVFALAVANEAQTTLAADADYIGQATDTKGNSMTVGNIANDGIAAGNPVRIGGKYTSSPAKVSGSGDVVDLALTQEGKLLDVHSTVAADTTNINNNYSSAQTNVSQQSAPGASKRIVVVEIIYSRDTAGNMKLVEDPAGTPATKFGAHYFPANGGMVATKCYIPLTTNKALGLTSVGGGNETFSARTIIENV